MIPGARTGAPKALVAILWAATLAAPTACDPAGPEPRGPIDDDTYVRVMSELADIRRFPPGGPDRASRDAAADSARRAVLDRYDVAVDDLLGFAEVVGEHPARMVEIAERISAVTDSLAERRTRGERTETADDAEDDAGAGAADADTGGAGAPDAAERDVREELDQLRSLRGGRVP